MYIPFCNLNDLFFYQSARHPIYIFNFIYYFPFVFIISSMFLVLVFVCLGVLFCFFFAQALCEVKEMLTQTWYFPTCSPLPFLSSTPVFFLSSANSLGFSGLGCSGWEEGMAIFHLQLLCKCQVFCQSTKNASLAGCFKKKI